MEDCQRELYDSDTEDASYPSLVKTPGEIFMQTPKKIVSATVQVETDHIYYLCCWN